MKMGADDFIKDGCGYNGGKKYFPFEKIPL